MEVFKRCMFDILNGFAGVLCLIDDSLVYSSVSEEEHDDKVQKVLNCLKDAGINLTPKKCLFCKSSMKFSGHIINEQYVHPDRNYIQDILELPAPTCLC